MIDALFYVSLGFVFVLFMGGAFSKPARPLTAREWAAVEATRKRQAARREWRRDKGPLYFFGAIGVFYVIIFGMLGAGLLVQHFQH